MIWGLCVPAAKNRVILVESETVASTRYERRPAAFAAAGGCVAVHDSGRCCGCRTGCAHSREVATQFRGAGQRAYSAFRWGGRGCLPAVRRDALGAACSRICRAGGGFAAGGGGLRVSQPETPTHMVFRGVQPTTARIESVEPFMRLVPFRRAALASPSALSVPAK